MKLTVHFTLLLLLFPVFVSAQDTVAFKPRLNAHFNFLGLLDVFDGNISAGGEYIFRSQWSAGLDAAYIFYSDYVQSKNVSGFIARPFVRYYTKPTQKTFFQFEIHYKHVGYSGLEDWVERDIVNGVPAYQEYIKYKWKKTVAGMNFEYGNRSALSRNHKLNLETYIGLGLRWRNQGADESYFPQAKTIFNGSVDAGKETQFVIPMGFRLVYLIK